MSPRHNLALRADRARAADGDEAALTAFYDTTSSLVHGLALKILGEAQAAEEVPALPSFFLGRALLENPRGASSTQPCARVVLHLTPAVAK